MLHAFATMTGAHHGLTASPVLLVTAVGVIAAATLTGAGLAGRGQDRRHLWLGAATGVLLVIALVHLLPDAWAGARAAGIPPWLVPTTAAATLVVNVALSRVGCGCETDEEHAGGVTSAAALTVHRFLEGAALGLTGPVTAVALAAHALGEGTAVAALLNGQRRRLATWLVMMCIGPAIGAVVTQAVPTLSVAEPLLLAVAAGVLVEAARVSLRAAFRPRPSGRRPTTTPAAAAVVAASLTALAIYGTG